MKGMHHYYDIILSTKDMFYITFCFSFAAFGTKIIILFNLREKFE